MKRVILLVLLIILMGCSSQQRGDIGITNQKSDKYLYFSRTYIVSDNATHLVVAFPKSEPGFWIKYRNEWDDK